MLCACIEFGLRCEVKCAEKHTGWAQNTLTGIA